MKETETNGDRERERAMGRAKGLLTCKFRSRLKSGFWVNGMKPKSKPFLNQLLCNAKPNLEEQQYTLNIQFNGYIT